MNIFIFGATGMLGSALFQYLRVFDGSIRTFGGYRKGSVLPKCPEGCSLVRVDDVFDEEAISKIFQDNDIDVVINAIGVIKQLKGQNSDVEFIRLNSLLPHLLADLAAKANARLINISTDCVFTGEKGMYTEDTIPDASDVYGRSKLLGEVLGRSHVINLRTSIIGHESGRAASLIDWFLGQSGQVNGYINAIFSGFPTVELARLISDKILPRPDLSGLWHASVEPINKFDLLSLVAEIYGHDIEIIPTDHPVIDRSLVSDRLRKEVGFAPLPWRKLVESMRENKIEWSK